jgi:hypothetical protein
MSSHQKTFLSHRSARMKHGRGRLKPGLPAPATRAAVPGECGPWGKRLLRQERRKECESEKVLWSGIAGWAGRCNQRVRRASNRLCAGLSGRSGCGATAAGARGRPGGRATGGKRAAARPSADDSSDPGAAAAAGGGCSRGARARLRLGAGLLGLARRLGMGGRRVCDSAQAPCGLGGWALGKTRPRVGLVWGPLAVSSLRAARSASFGGSGCGKPAGGRRPGPPPGAPISEAALSAPGHMRRPLCQCERDKPAGSRRSEPPAVRPSRFHSLWRRGCVILLKLCGPPRCLSG